MKLNVLGTVYEIKFQTQEENPKLTDDINGLAELYSKELFVKTGYENNPDCYNNIEAYREKVLIHECMHAIFHESGLSKYTEDEDLVEFLAQQYGKIISIVERAKFLHGEYMKTKTNDVRR